LIEMKWASAFLLLACASVPSRAASVTVDILYVEQQNRTAPVLSRLVSPPEDEGLAGVLLGIQDNTTTGKFLGHDYRLQTVEVGANEDPVAAARNELAVGARIAVFNVPAEAMKRISALPEAKDDLLINAGAPDNSLRGEDCRANLLHTLPSRDMLADALFQFLVKRQWDEVFLLAGQRPDDVLFAEALRNAARKFRVRIVEDESWLADADIRRNAAQEVPVLTQARAYDMVVVADEARDFAPFIPFNTWLARPVGGSAGLRPVAWSPVMEQWGAMQLQSRFEAVAGRGMTSVDYAAWAAVRTIGEAVARIGTNDIPALLRYIVSDDFALAGFKGRKLSFRRWDGQMRQPIPLVQPEAVVTMAPIEGFLHQYNELDTLGQDEVQSTCTNPVGALQ